MATQKAKAAQKKSGGAKVAAKAPAKKSAATSAKPAAKQSADHTAHELAKALAAHLGLSEAATIERALEDLAMAVGLHGHKHEQPGPKVIEKAEPRTASGSIAAGGYLPRRLYLRLDGRGLDGTGMPIEVIDVPCTIGSGRRNTIWINSPQVETLHAQIVQTDDGWVFEDIGSEHGTFLNDKKIDHAVIHDGDTFLLAGYLRMKAELR